MTTKTLSCQLIGAPMIFAASLLMIACGGGGGGGGDAAPMTSAPATAASASLSYDIKTFRFSWTDVSDASYYRLTENPDGASGFSQVGQDIPAGTEAYDHVVPLYARIGASYILESCNDAGCTDGDEISVSDTLVEAVGYFKASNTAGGDEFGLSVSLSADGAILAIGAQQQNGGEGAVYVFRNSGGTWSEQQFIKEGTPAAGNLFGRSVSLNADGDKLAIGVPGEGMGAGIAYIYTRSGNSWSLEDTVSAGFNADANDEFGAAVSLSDDGSTLAVGARAEASADSGLGSGGADPSDDGAPGAGAAYIFTETGGSWSQQEYFKASNAAGGNAFGISVALSADGDTFVVGANEEDSDSTGVGSVPTDTANSYGAAYVFVRSGNTWSQQEYIKPDVINNNDSFGISVALSNNGNTLAVAADSVNTNTGAVYVFTRSGVNWSQQATVTASNAESGDGFGTAVSLSANGNTLVVGAQKEQSAATGVDGNENDNSNIASGNGAGAAYVFTRSAGSWQQASYLKASNTGDNDFFGNSVAISGDGDSIAVGADTEGSNATGIGGNGANNGAPGAGAAYLY